MALQDNSSVPSYSPQQVANAFVNQYYQTLRKSPEHVHRFYTDSSTLGRQDSNGVMISVTTMHDINAQIMSTDYTGYVIELQTVDAQTSYMSGVLILVTGSFTTPETVKKKFTQSFFLAPQGNGVYFVLNDVFRFVSEMPSTVINEVLEETASSPESMVPSSLPVNHVTTGPSANGVAPVKNDTGVEASANAAKHVEMPEAAPTVPAVKVATTTAPAVKVATTTTAPVEKAAPPTASAEKAAPSTSAAKSTPASAEKGAPTVSAEKATQSLAEVPAAPAPTKDVTKKTYASIVKVMRESAPAPAPASTVKTKPIPPPKAAQNGQKSVTSVPKHAQANIAPSGDKNIPKSKQPDEPGFSIFVKNLPYNSTVEMVEQEFKKFGAIKPGGIQVRNRQFDEFCFGFVEFESKHSMQEALEEGIVYFGMNAAYIQEKRTTTRVVNGVITRGDDNAGGNRFQSGRGGYQGANFRGRGDGYGNNGNYHDGDKMNGYRNQNRGQGQQGNVYYQNKNGYHQNGYAKNVNQQRRPSNNSNGNGKASVERANGPVKQTPAAA